MNKHTMLLQLHYQPCLIDDLIHTRVKIVIRTKGTPYYASKHLSFLICKLIFCHIEIFT